MRLPDWRCTVTMWPAVTARAFLLDHLYLPCQDGLCPQTMSQINAPFLSEVAFFHHSATEARKEEHGSQSAAW